MSCRVNRFSNERPPQSPGPGSYSPVDHVHLKRQRSAGRPTSAFVSKTRRAGIDQSTSEGIGVGTYDPPPGGFYEVNRDKEVASVETPFGVTSQKRPMVSEETPGPGSYQETRSSFEQPNFNIVKHSDRTGFFRTDKSGFANILSKGTDFGRASSRPPFIVETPSPGPQHYFNPAEEGDVVEPPRPQATSAFMVDVHDRRFTEAVQRQTRLDDVPGVGAYDFPLTTLRVASQSVRLHQPSERGSRSRDTSIGVEVHQQAGVPGPGAYRFDKDQRLLASTPNQKIPKTRPHTAAFAPAIQTADRKQDTIAALATPGPGAYDKNNNASFTKDVIKRNDALKSPWSLPHRTAEPTFLGRPVGPAGPGTYDPRPPTVAEPAGPTGAGSAFKSLSSGPGTQVCAPSGLNITPAPGYYSPEQARPAPYKSRPLSSLASRSRRVPLDNISSIYNPAPGQYDSKVHELSRPATAGGTKRGAHFGTRRFNTYEATGLDSQAPSPQSYRPELPSPPSSAATMTKEKRVAHNVIVDTPGPGAYEMAKPLTDRRSFQAIDSVGHVDAHR